MNKTTLHQIAQEMRAELPAIGRVERVINRTLIQLLARNGQLQLLIGHPDTYPCIEDAQLIADAFGVAAYTEPRPQIARIASQDGQAVKVKSCVYTWREAISA